MTFPDQARPTTSPLSTRLSRLAPLNAGELDLLSAAERDTRLSPAGCELIAEGEPIRERRAVVSGWGCRQRLFADGRRQIISFVLPGDVIGMSHHTRPIASASTLALTAMTTCPLPAAERDSGLWEAYARSSALESAYREAHVSRLGRLSAYERLADLLLETRERLVLAGLAAAGSFPLPLTQEVLADALGLSVVHVNRTLQALRSDGHVVLRGGTVSLPNPSRLENLVDHRPARVSTDG